MTEAASSKGPFPVKIAASGDVIEPEVHDSNCYGLINAPEGVLTLLFESEDKQNRFEITVPKVERLWVEYFRQGNIVFDICIYYRGYQSWQTAIRDAQQELGKDISGKNKPDKRSLDSELEQTLSRYAAALRLHSSYGMSLVACGNWVHNDVSWFHV